MLQANFKNVDIHILVISFHNIGQQSNMIMTSEVLMGCLTREDIRRERKNYWKKELSSLQSFCLLFLVEQRKAKEYITSRIETVI
ncbi:unnamed protein product [Camellia sinensis]